MLIFKFSRVKTFFNVNDDVYVFDVMSYSNVFFSFVFSYSMSKSRAWAIATIVVVACIVAVAIGLGIALQRDDKNDDKDVKDCPAPAGPQSSSRLTKDSPIYVEPTKMNEGFYRFASVSTDAKICSYYGT